MKVIDLLNRIANGEEVPKKIQVYQDIFVLDNSNKLYEQETTRTNLLSIYNGNILNHEVKIKEDKGIENNFQYVYSCDNEMVNANFENIRATLENIIKAINEMREDK